MNTSSDEQLTKRFYILNTCVTIILLAIIVVSISQFGVEAWEGRKQIGFIIPGNKTEAGWNQTQYRGIKSACDELGYELLLRENVSSDINSCRQTVQELAEKGARVIFFANAYPLSDIKEFEKNYPRIKFYTIESISALSTGGKYSIRAFEASYLAGILAGIRTKTNLVGYIAPYSEAEVNQGINAFTLGVQRVKASAQVLVSWTGSWNNPAAEEQAVRNLKAEHVDVLTFHQNGTTIPAAAERADIPFISFHDAYPSHSYYIAAIKINWKVVYLNILRRYNRQAFYANYGVGLAQNMVNVDINNSNLSSREFVNFEAVRWEIQRGRLIFSGEIFDRNGVQRCAANETISNQSLQNNMDWLIRGVRVLGN